MKENYVNEEWFDKHGFHKDFPTSLEELEATQYSANPKTFRMGDVVILESSNTEPGRALSMDYHQDRRFWFGGVPHLWNFNIYTNDDYEGGAIRFINTHNATRKKYIDKFSKKEHEYLEVDDFVEYKMEAGDGLIFPADYYHAVTPVTGHKFYIRQFLSAKLPQEYWDEEKLHPDKEEWAKFLKDKEIEGFKNRESMMLFDSPDDIDLDNPMYENWDGVLIPCVLKPGTGKECFKA